MSVNGMNRYNNLINESFTLTIENTLLKGGVPSETGQDSV